MRVRSAASGRATHTATAATRRPSPCELDLSDNTNRWGAPPRRARRCATSSSDGLSRYPYAVRRRAARRAHRRRTSASTRRHDHRGLRLGRRARFAPFARSASPATAARAPGPDVRDGADLRADERPRPGRRAARRPDGELDVDRCSAAARDHSISARRTIPTGSAHGPPATIESSCRRRGDAGHRDRRRGVRRVRGADVDRIGAGTASECSSRARSRRRSGSPACASATPSARRR